jgi:GAF domain-containing protein
MVDGIVGVIHIAKFKPAPFTCEDQKLVEIVAERVALALERIVRSKIGFKTGMSLKDFL